MNPITVTAELFPFMTPVRYQGERYYVEDHSPAHEAAMFGGGTVVVHSYTRITDRLLRDQQHCVTSTERQSFVVPTGSLAIIPEKPRKTRRSARTTPEAGEAPQSVVQSQGTSVPDQGGPIEVVGKGRFRTVPAAFRALGLALTRCAGFRLRLKEQGRAEFDGLMFTINT